MSSVETATPFPVTAAEYGKGEYRRKIEPEPPHSCRYEMNGAGTAACCIFDDESLPGGIGFCPPLATSGSHLLPCPFTPGQVLAIQEQYKLVRPETGDIVADFNSPLQVRYYADDNPRYRDRDDDWQPASAMPLWAVRKLERVTTVSVDGGEWVVRTQECWLIGWAAEGE